MTDKKTLVVFGAGPGLGVSLAKKFGSEGCKIALVARDAATLDGRVAELAEAGVEATAFPADLTDIEGLPSLVQKIEQDFGGIDFAVFAPVSADAVFVPAKELDASTMERLFRLLTLAPIEIGRALLPNMIARSSGALMVVDGTSAVHTIPGLSGVGPAFAATRNWILTLNEEIKHDGLYAGTLHVGALIDRSAGMKIATAGGRSLDPAFPLIDPDEVADEIWKLVTERDRTEAMLP